MIIVLICADLEWATLPYFYPHLHFHSSPLGEWVESKIASHRVVFFHAGWGKIHSASSTQYCIDRWQPSLLINLGTCGGIKGRCNQGDLLLAKRTVVYDIHELMGDAQAAIEHYSTNLNVDLFDLTQFPQLKTAIIASADADLMPADITSLLQCYNATAADWESGAIAFVARQNHIPCLVMRGVSDMVGETGSLAYHNLPYYKQETEKVMKEWFVLLPSLIEAVMRKNDEEMVDV